MSFRIQTVNHAAGGRLIVLKRDNSHELDQKPRPPLQKNWVVIDADTMEITHFDDPLLLARHVQQIEQRINTELLQQRQAEYASAISSDEE